MSRAAGFALCAVCALATLGCVGADESDAWAVEETREGPPPTWEGDPDDWSKEDARPRQRDERVSRAQRNVAEGEGWRVTATGAARPVETFASADGPVGFAPADPPSDDAPAPSTDAAPAAPWVEVPSEELPPGAAAPERTRLRLRAEGVELAPGRCGPVPVARYGLDWRPEREWRLGQDEDPTPWLRPLPPPPLPPLPTEAEPTVEEAETPAGSWIEAR